MSEPYYQDEYATLYHGDCLDVLAELPDASVDAVVTDPPYGLKFMGKEWDAPWADSGMNADAGFRGGGLNQTKGLPSFTGSTNPKCLTCKDTRRGRRDGTAKVAVCLCPDGGRFPNTRAVEMRAFQDWCAAWTAECLRVLKPGGHLLAFGGSRTWHRLAAAVEDAGFEIRDSIAWLYGSGFPKSLDVSKAIDKRPGVMRHAEFGAMLREAMTAKGYTNTSDVAEKVIGRRTGAVANWVKYQFPEAKWWPALRDLLDLDDAVWSPVIAEAERAKTGKHDGGSPIGTFVSRINGTDAPTAKDRRDVAATADAERWQGWGTALKPAFEPIVVGRKPLDGTVSANVLAHGTGALNIDACRTPVDGPESRNAPDGRWPTNVVLDESQAGELDEQSGGASRFFPTFRYEAKAPTSERPRYHKSVLRLRDDLTPEQVGHVRARLAEAGVQVD